MIAAIGTIIATSRPEIQLQARFFGMALGNGELVAPTAGSKSNAHKNWCCIQLMFLWLEVKVEKKVMEA